MGTGTKIILGSLVYFAVLAAYALSAPMPPTDPMGFAAFVVVGIGGGVFMGMGLTERRYERIQNRQHRSVSDYE